MHQGGSGAVVVHQIRRWQCLSEVHDDRNMIVALIEIEGVIQPGQQRYDHKGQEQQEQRSNRQIGFIFASLTDTKHGVNEGIGVETGSTVYFR